MPNYDFQSLSSYDFEILVRDLLQRELKVRLESFARGRDGGIDFRFRSSKGDLVVQCKHYASYDDLIKVLRRDEAPKVERLKPVRYILAVSTPLTPHRKDEMLGLFGPYCRTPGDIFGRDDLNNLLGIHSDIERNQIKLWLTSNAVLTKILNDGIWGDAELTLDRIRNRTSRYVPNPSLLRARQVLDAQHHCIIAGIPGIGKTTLAEILLIEHVDRHGFQAIRIANELSEIKAVKDPNRLQIFYFDDFLGKTALDKLQKNEDQRLTDFIQEVTTNKNWRFVLTTREYILNAARIRYESLASPPVDLSLCIVNLSDYTYPIRAKILYNHIYFSDISSAHKRALLDDRKYKEILLHKNYNPRIVDHMTQRRHLLNIPPAEYFHSFIANLENPVRIWDHAFRNQLSEAAQHVLLVMGSLPDQVLVADLDTAFREFYQYRRSRLGFATSSRDFEHALKALDGNFIKTSLIGKNQVVEFHNPSVRDFLEYYLSESPREIADLIEASVFFDQFIRLWRGRAGVRFAGIDSHSDRFSHAIARKISAPDCELKRIGYEGKILSVERLTQSFESRVSFAIAVSNGLNTSQANGVVQQLLESLQARIEAGQGDKGDLIRLLRKLVPGDSSSGAKHPVIIASKRFLSFALDDFEDFDCLGKFVECYPAIFSPVDLQDIRKTFARYCDEYEDSNDDADSIRSFADDVERVGVQLEVDVNAFCEGLVARAAELDSEREEHDLASDDRDEDWDGRTSIAEDVEGMFDDLLHEIDENT